MQERREEYQHESPAVQELQKELAVATGIVVANCANDMETLCHGEKPQDLNMFLLPPNMPIADKMPPPPMEGEGVQPADDGWSFSLVWFTSEDGGKRKLKTARKAANRARRNLRMMMSYDDFDAELEEKNSHDDNHHHHHKDKDGKDFSHSHSHSHDGPHSHSDSVSASDDHEEKGKGHKRPCGKHGQQVPFKLGFSPEEDQCMIDLLISGSPDISDNCYAAVEQEKMVYNALNEQIQLEEAAEEFAAFLFLMTSFLLTLSILSCVFGKHRGRHYQGFVLRRSIVEAVYADDELKSAVQARLPEGLVLGENPPLRAAQEPCTCKRFCKAFCCGFIFMFAAITLLHLFLFVPILLPVTLVFMTVRACCRKRRRSATEGDYAILAQEGYPAAASEKELELKEDKVYVGVPTVA